MQPDESFVGSPIHWLRYALSDLELACAKPSHVLLEMLCFHAQQAVEKAVKAVLLAQGVEFPKTHNLRVLFDLLAEQIDIPQEVVIASRLTEYAVSSRYPGEVEEVTEEEYQGAINLAREVVNWAKSIIDAPKG